MLEGADQSRQQLDTGPGGVQPVPAPLHVGVQLQPGRDPGHSHHSQHHHVARRPLLPHRSSLLASSAATSKPGTQGPEQLCTSSPVRESMSLVANYMWDAGLQPIRLFLNQTHVRAW